MEEEHERPISLFNLTQNVIIIILIHSQYRVLYLIREERPQLPMLLGFNRIHSWTCAFILFKRIGDLCTGQSKAETQDEDSLDGFHVLII